MRFMYFNLASSAKIAKLPNFNPSQNFYSYSIATHCHSERNNGIFLLNPPIEFRQQSIMTHANFAAIHHFRLSFAHLDSKRIF